MITTWRPRAEIAGPRPPEARPDASPRPPEARPDASPRPPEARPDASPRPPEARPDASPARPPPAPTRPAATERLASGRDPLAWGMPSSPAPGTGKSPGTVQPPASTIAS